MTVFQKTGNTKEIKSSLKFTVQQGWLFIKFKKVKKYFHDALTSGTSTNNLNLIVKWSK